MITIHTNPTINRPQLARLFADGFIDDPRVDRHHAHPATP